MRGKLVSLTLFLIFQSSFISAQEVQIKGGFVQDSLGLGTDIHFWITAAYPAQMEIFFADSNANFSPFEYASKYYQPTQLRGDIAFDSTVYALQSFEIDLVQYLQLPAYLVAAKDSLTLFTPLDSIYFQELVPIAAVSDTTGLIQNTAYVSVTRFFNFPLFWIIIAVIILIVILVAAIYGKRIRRAFIVRRLKKEQRLFSNYFAPIVENLKTSPDQQGAEKGLIVWKKYMERLEAKPISKLTTKEILAFEFTNELENPLNSIDRSVYGRFINEELYKSFQALDEYAQHRCNVQIEYLKNGK